MSVYKSKNSPFYQYDFQWRGSRFHGSTKRTNRREAEVVEKAERDRAKKQAAETSEVSGSLQLEHIASRYWAEVGKHHAGNGNTFRDLCRLVDYFGPTRLLSEITNNEVAQLVAWRRGHRVVRKPGAKANDGPLISNATVNRSTTEVLRKLFTKAKKAWGFKFSGEPDWKVHLLSEPKERVRELTGDEYQALFSHVRDDYEPILRFALASGRRFSKCLLKWEQVDWGNKTIFVHGKGGKIEPIPITKTIREILWPLQNHHECVFTYVAQRTRLGRVRGERYPITKSGLKTEWKRLRKRTGIKDFRFHDLRHDYGTKLLRETGNLKLVQKAMHHADIKTTSRYAHVTDTEVTEAMERVDQSRNKSRNDRRKAG